jgi:hypothetical protein
MTTDHWVFTKLNMPNVENDIFSDTGRVDDGIAKRKVWDHKLVLKKL